MRVVAIETGHWPEIMSIQDRAYTQIGAEPLTVLQAKWKASPETCFVCLADEGEVMGYLLAHPWYSHEPPPLFESLPELNECSSIYLHDLAVSDSSRGLGVGRCLIEALFEKVRVKAFETARLVAVQNSSNYWAKFGFEVCSTQSGIDPSYGKDAMMMEKHFLYT